MEFITFRVRKVKREDKEMLDYWDVRVYRDPLAYPVAGDKLAREDHQETKEREAHLDPKVLILIPTFRLFLGQDVRLR